MADYIMIRCDVPYRVNAVIVNNHMLEIDDECCNLSLWAAHKVPKSHHLRQVRSADVQQIIVYHALLSSMITIR